MGLPSTRTSSPSFTFVPISGTLPLMVTRRSSMRTSAARLEQKPTSLRYLLMRVSNGREGRALSSYQQKRNATLILILPLILFLKISRMTNRNTMRRRYQSHSIVCNPQSLIILLFLILRSGHHFPTNLRMPYLAAQVGRARHH